MKKSVLTIAISLVFLLAVLSVSVVDAAYQSFTVSAGSSQRVTIYLSEGDSVSGSLSVSGGSGNDINFRATDPNGNSLEYQDRTSYYSFSFTAYSSGTYTLTFDNSFSYFSSKSVSLSYSVVSPTPVPFFGGSNDNSGGLSYVLIIAAIIVVLVIVAVIIVVIVKATGHSKANTSYLSPPPPPVYS